MKANSIDDYKDIARQNYPEKFLITFQARQKKRLLLYKMKEHSIQPWHGAGVFKYTKNNKIKFYTLPILYLESINAIPLALASNPHEPICYLHPNLKINTISEFIHLLKNNYTRTRKS